MERIVRFGLLPIVGVCLGLSTAGATEASGLSPNIFGPAAGASGRLSVPAYATRYEPVSVDFGVLETASMGSRLTLNLFADLSFVGEIRSVSRRPSGGYTLTGTLPDQPDGSFIIVAEQDVAVATIRLPGVPRIFQLHYAGSGTHMICEMDGTQYPECKGSVPDADTLGGVPGTEGSPGESGDMIDGNAESAACVRLQPVFDVMIIYTALARQRAGGSNAIIALCHLAIAESNQAYAQSQIDARMRLVFIGESSYTEGGGYDAYLNWIKNNSQVQTLRNDYAADFVSFWVDDSSYCGLGSCYDGSYTTCAWHCATGYYSFSHEIGHNQGCDHDRENAGGASCSVYGYSYGWRFNGNSGTQYRTIMSYAPGTRIQYFSNPNVFFDGQPTGVAVGETGQAHNALSITNKTNVGETKRNSRFDVWVDFTYFGLIKLGTFSNPYNSAATGAAQIITGAGASELPTLHIKTGSTNETPILNQKMIVRPCGGSVIIGRF